MDHTLVNILGSYFVIGFFTMLIYVIASDSDIRIKTRESFALFFLWPIIFLFYVYSGVKSFWERIGVEE